MTVDSNETPRTGIVFTAGFDFEGCEEAAGAVRIQDKGILHEPQRDEIGSTVPTLDVLLLDSRSLDSDVGRYACASVKIGAEVLVVDDSGQPVPLDKEQKRPPLPLAGGQAPRHEGRTPVVTQTKLGEI